MDLHIYNTEINPGDVIVITGTISEVDINQLCAYAASVQAAFPDHPLVCVPGETTFDCISDESLVNLFADAFDKKSLEKMRDVINRAIEKGASGNEV